MCGAQVIYGFKKYGIILKITVHILPAWESNSSLTHSLGMKELTLYIFFFMGLVAQYPMMTRQFSCVMPNSVETATPKYMQGKWISNSPHVRLSPVHSTR